MTGGTVASTAGALLASVCFGTAAVLQAIGARRTARARGIDLRLMWRLTRSPPYLAGLGLDLVGFLFALVAMRSLPLFAVEAILASYVGVAALLANRVLRARLRSGEWLALCGVAAGLIMVASSVSAQPTPPVGAGRWWLPVVTLVLGGSAMFLGRLRSPAGAALIAFVGGVLWGLVAIATRVVRDPGSVADLVTDPAAYTVLAAGALGLLLYTTALQRTSVTAATAMAIVGETLAPAATGLLLLGDEPRPGAGPLAVVGFVLTVGGALALARHGDLEPPTDTSR
jgi:drug/metabolite transporter (DMT)-like permease